MQAELEWRGLWDADTARPKPPYNHIEWFDGEQALTQVSALVAQYRTAQYAKTNPTGLAYGRDARSGLLGATVRPKIPLTATLRQLWRDLEDFETLRRGDREAIRAGEVAERVALRLEILRGRSQEDDIVPRDLYSVLKTTANHLDRSMQRSNILTGCSYLEDLRDALQDRSKELLANSDEVYDLELSLREGPEFATRLSNDDPRHQFKDDLVQLTTGLAKGYAQSIIGRMSDPEAAPKDRRRAEKEFTDLIAGMATFVLGRKGMPRTAKAVWRQQVKRWAVWRRLCRQAGRLQSGFTT